MVGTIYLKCMLQIESQSTDILIPPIISLVMDNAKQSFHYIKWLPTIFFLWVFILTHCWRCDQSLSKHPYNISEMLESFCLLNVAASAGELPAKKVFKGQKLSGNLSKFVLHCLLSCLFYTLHRICYERTIIHNSDILNFLHAIKSKPCLHWNICMILVN